MIFVMNLQKLILKGKIFKLFGFLTSNKKYYFRYIKTKMIKSECRLKGSRSFR